MKRTDSGLFIITLFVTGDHYNYTLGQTDIFVADWPRGRLHHWPEDAWGGGWSTVASFYCYNHWVTLDGERHLNASHIRVNFPRLSAKHKPELTGRSLGITGVTYLPLHMILMCLIFMFHTEETNPADLFDHFTCIHFASLSKGIQVAWEDGVAPGIAHQHHAHTIEKHIFVRKCRDWEKKTWNKERNGTDASVSLKYAHRNREGSQKYEYVKRKKCIFEGLLIYLLKLELNVKKAEANAVKILKYQQKRCRYTHQVAGFVSEVMSTVTVAVLSSILNRLHMSGVQTAEKYYYETIKKHQSCNC